MCDVEMTVKSDKCWKGVIISLKSFSSTATLRIEGNDCNGTVNLICYLLDHSNKKIYIYS